VVLLAPIDGALADLLRVLARHSVMFPPEAHDELLAILGRIGAVVDLDLPLELVGSTVPCDSTPVVRLTPDDAGNLAVEIGVRPVAGAVHRAPGEGPVLALGTLAGGRVSAMRAPEAERERASSIAGRLPLIEACRRGPWWWKLDTLEGSLAVVEALATMGRDEVVVEWPESEAGWLLRGTARRQHLRVRVSAGRDWLGVEGSVDVDGTDAALGALLEAIRLGKRYVVVGPRQFVAIASDLRDALAPVADVVFDAPAGLIAGLAAAPLLAELMVPAASAEDSWSDLRERVAAASRVEPRFELALETTLRPYQEDGVRWLSRLAAWGAGACLADEMGLGKTLQAIALLADRAALGPALVVAPASVLFNWRREVARHAPSLRARPYRGPDRENVLSTAVGGDVLIASYDVAARDVDSLAAITFSTLVLDEAQSVKNATTRRAKAISRLSARFRVALTGTPIENHLGELWSLFATLCPGLLGTWPQFRERFAGPIEIEASAERRAALARVVRPFLLRRTKVEVAPELPARIELERSVELSAGERALYENARLSAVAAVEGADGDPMTLLGWITRLRRIACHPRLHDEGWTGRTSKLTALLSLMEELRDGGHRALVFSQFTDHLSLVREALVRAGYRVSYLDGATPVEDRARRVDEFQNGHTDAFLISLRAGGTGLNLTGADYVIHLDPWWNPAVEDQATDRAHRIGQTRPVTVVRFVCRGTIEEAVLGLHAEKRELARSVLEGTAAVGRLSMGELAALVRAGEGGVQESAEDDLDVDLEVASSP
jgi:hypothetical protein